MMHVCLRHIESSMHTESPTTLQLLPFLSFRHFNLRGFPSAHPHFRFSHSPPSIRTREGKNNSRRHATRKNPLANTQEWPALACSHTHIITKRARDREPRYRNAPRVRWCCTYNNDSRPSLEKNPFEKWRLEDKRKWCLVLKRDAKRGFKKCLFFEAHICQCSCLNKDGQTWKGLSSFFFPFKQVLLNPLLYLHKPSGEKD